MKDGKPGLKELNDSYFNTYKEDPDGLVYTGFRIWKKNSKADYTSSADAAGVNYQLQDWSSQITFPSTETEKTPEDMMDGMMNGTMTEDEKMKLQAEKDMIFMSVIIVAVAIVLIMIVVIIFCRLRARANQKTPIQLNEGGELEMGKVTQE